MCKIAGKFYKFLVSNGLAIPKIPFGIYFALVISEYTSVSALRTVRYGLTSAVVVKGCIKLRHVKTAWEHSLGSLPTISSGCSVTISSQIFQRSRGSYPGSES